MNDLDIARIKDIKTKMSNGGWRYDTHPYMDGLDANKTIEIAYIKGPAVIKCIHVTKHEIMDFLGNRRKYMPRGIVLLIYYDDMKEPAVQVPLADFFCDGLNGKTDHFSNIFFEHAPESYNCYILMPFKKSCKVCLRNDTPFDTMSYSYVEYEELDNWDDSLGYFHATYKKILFQLKDDTILNLFKISDNRGHIIGRQLSISTNEPAFAGFTYIMEGNVEIRIDTDKPNHQGPYTIGKGPTYDYLGSEDSFGLSWGWNKYIGKRSGCPYYNTLDVGKLLKEKFFTNFKDNNDNDYSSNISKTIKEVYLDLKDIKNESNLTELSVYRFFYPNIIRFKKAIDLRINWVHEFTNLEFLKPYKETLKELAETEDRLNVDFANVMYWYQDKIGYNHDELPPFEKRI